MKNIYIKIYLFNLFYIMSYEKFIYLGIYDNTVFMYHKVQDLTEYKNVISADIYNILLKDNFIDRTFKVIVFDIYSEKVNIISIHHKSEHPSLTRTIYNNDCIDMIERFYKQRLFQNDNEVYVILYDYKMFSSYIIGLNLSEIEFQLNDMDIHIVYFVNTN